MKKRFTEEQIIAILGEADRDGVVIRDVFRRHNVTEHTFFRWGNKYGGMTVSEAKRLKELEAENAKLKKLLAEQLLVTEGLRGQPPGRRVHPPASGERSAAWPGAAAVWQTDLHPLRQRGRVHGDCRHPVAARYQCRPGLH